LPCSIPSSITRIYRIGNRINGSIIVKSCPMSVYWQLIRPGLLLAVLFSMATAALTAPEPPPGMRLVHAMLGTALLIAGATAMNQLMERRQDAVMPRTVSRPLPSNRLHTGQAAIFAVMASLGGVIWLLVVGLLNVALLAVLNWCIYVLIYTPLKRVSIWHVPVGALAGAIPVLLGTATTDAIFAPVSLTLFGIVFFWQFPHTAAIGWIYRNQYVDSRMKVAAVVDPSGPLCGWMAVLGSTGALIASLCPATQPAVGWPYLASALLAGLVQTVSAVKFLKESTDKNAHVLWWVSLVYLPVLLALLLFVR
jgi:heme o synthase